MAPRTPSPRLLTLRGPSKSRCTKNIKQHTHTHTRLRYAPMSSTSGRQFFRVYPAVQRVCDQMLRCRSVHIARSYRPAQPFPFVSPYPFVCESATWTLCVCVCGSRWVWGGAGIDHFMQTTSICIRPSVSGSSVHSQLGNALGRREMATAEEADEWRPPTGL